MTSSTSRQCSFYDFYRIRFFADNCCLGALYTKCASLLKRRFKTILTMEPQKRIAIVGAGPSGLVAAKEALENGLIPTVFESKSDIGGVWSTSGSVWDTMHTNISKFTTTFGDFRWPDDTEMFPSAYDMLYYLNEYTTEWKLRAYIKFNANVVSVASNGEDPNNIALKGWAIQWIENGAPLQTDLFDGVIVAAGIFSKGDIPELPGLSAFGGKVIHSRDYKSGQSFKGLKVLTVGGSFSGAEIASDVSNHSAVSHHCFRRPFWILNRYLPDKKSGKSSLPLDLLFYTRSFYEMTTTVTEEESNISKNKYMSSICKQQQDIAELTIEEEDFHKPYNVTVSDQYLEQVEQKTLIPHKSEISEINNSTIRFANDDTIEVDAIILCTGFNTDLSFLAPNVLQKIMYEPTDRLQPVILFNECCHPDVKNLFFVGLYKGPYFAVMEQQARLAARVLSGRVDLPNLELLTEGLKYEKAIRDANPRPQFPHPEYVLFADKIATCANSFPDLKKFKESSYSLSDAFGVALKENALHLEQQKSEIYERFMSEPVTPSHYNLVEDPIGTLSQMDVVQEVIQKL
ncbi:Flavin-containing monooxygenase 5 [Pseudolycoriella hygida]|uniref:Flavin-containing monooxygenase n=1 Tax=Pseudolycoriella hygida TaxID=35572 RepID=A0A9Q0NEQ1_9DIPT|nr:Flavin-containing monooxygenase 5 [Pseudolycoriella hygida]